MISAKKNIKIKIKKLNLWKEKISIDLNFFIFRVTAHFHKYFRTKLKSIEHIYFASMLLIKETYKLINISTNRPHTKFIHTNVNIHVIPNKIDFSWCKQNCLSINLTIRRGFVLIYLLHIKAFD